MFSSVIQPPVLSIFSSTNSDALGLFSTHSDAALPADSFIHLLHDGANSPPPVPPANLISPDEIKDSDSTIQSPNYALNQTVLHIQSPTLRTTYIHSPPNQLPGLREQPDDLHVKHPWMHLQVRSLGRHWSLEVGLVDHAGRNGIIRLSTFQKHPRLIMNSHQVPLLHLPLAFPHSTSRPLTAWSTLSLHLPHYIQHFSSMALLSSSDHGRIQPATNLPTGSYSHASYVRVYATCRLRRIWFADGGPAHEIPWEFQLFGFDHQGE